MTAWTVAKYPDMKVSSRSRSGRRRELQLGGKSSGRGTLSITRSEPDKGIATISIRQWEVCLPGRHQPGAIRRIGERHLVKRRRFGWNPVSRFFGLFIINDGPDFEEGCESAKEG